MACAESLPAFDAFENQLKTLCLNEFPCGIGNWREFHGKKKWTKNDAVNSKFFVTLKDFGPQHEKTETLEELVQSKHSPWNLDYSWSDEARQLREIAVRSPWLIDEHFVLGHFKTLRIVDKGVTEVDEGLLKFVNLEELSLSANQLRTVNSACLPRKLKSLELCANNISNLADLCMSPPPLLHLGLGYNRLTLVDDYITGEFWPHLLSLDMSHNNLSDLVDIVRKLSSLPKLRNLVLQGNPLSLIPGYRGYTIDSLRKLDFLDDIGISADEKHHYKGLAKRKEYILDEAKLIFQVGFMKGMPMPEEMKNPEDQPEYPIITRKFFVQFMFLEDQSSKAEIFQILHDDNFTITDTQRTDGQETGTIMGGSVLESARDTRGSQLLSEKNVNFAEQAQILAGPDAPKQQQEGQIAETVTDTHLEIPDIHVADTASEVQEEMGTDRTVEDKPAVEPAAPYLRLAPVNSMATVWSAEQVDLHWSQIVVRDDLLSLRNFFKQGMDIAVVEEKIQSYPADQIQDGILSPTGSKSGKEGKGKGEKKDKKDDKPKDKGKAQKAGGKGDKSADEGAKKKKKKGEPEEDLVNMPSEYTTLCTFHIPLEDFLEGDFEFENVFTHQWQSTEGSLSPTISEGSRKEGKKDKKKPGSGKKKDGKEKERGKSPKGDKKDTAKEKGKEKGKGVAEGDEEPAPPPPLEIQVAVKLHHWKTALDSMREELGSNAPEEEQAQE